MSAGGAGARAGFLVYRRGMASAGGGVVGVPLGGRRTGSGAAGRGMFCCWVAGGCDELTTLRGAFECGAGRLAALRQRRAQGGGDCIMR